MKLEDGRDLYLEHLRVERNLSEHTIAAYARDLEGLIGGLKHEGVRSMERVRPAQVAHWLRGLASAGKAASSQARALSAARQWFRYGVRSGWVEQNPAKALDGPKRARHLPDTLSRAEVEAMLEYGGGEDRSPSMLRDRAILELLYACGLRVSEVCGLKLGMIDRELGFVRPVGKGDKERIVPIGEAALRAIEDYLAEGRAHLEKGRRNEYVFLGYRARPISRMAVYNLVKRAALKAGIARKVSPHTLRHAFATHLLQGGADLRIIQTLLGHADLSTTEVYTHVDVEAVRSAIDQYHPMSR